jgi:hypothetical protein
MQLLLRDPSYTERLVAFLTSVGRHAVVAAPDRVILDEHEDDLRSISRSRCICACGPRSTRMRTSSWPWASPRRAFLRR